MCVQQSRCLVAYTRLEITTEAFLKQDAVNFCRQGEVVTDTSVCCSQIFVERARLALLAWGDKQDISELQQQYPGGFDIILGADVVYVEEFVPHLFRTARALINPAKQAIHFVKPCGTWPSCYAYA